MGCDIVLEYRSEESTPPSTIVLAKEDRTNKGERNRDDDRDDDHDDSAACGLHQRDKGVPCLRTTRVQYLRE